MDQEKLNTILDSRIKLKIRHSTRNNRTAEEHQEATYIPYVIPVPLPCNDCGKIVEGLDQKIYVSGLGTRWAQWKKKCRTCGIYLNLQGKKFLLK